MSKILIVEDDTQIAKSLKMNLKLSGHDVEHVDTCATAWAAVNSAHYDLVCLDVGLPDGCGLDLCQKIRDSGNEVPVIFISALVDEKTVVKGISCGGDDYIRKPFGMDEFKARMQKSIKRFCLPVSTINLGPLTIDSAKRVVTFMDNVINLGRKELEILLMLVKKSGDIVTRENILSSLYEDSDAYDRTIDSHMSHLRKKLREVAGQSIQIVSIYGLGYRLEIK